MEILKKSHFTNIKVGDRVRTLILDGFVLTDYTLDLIGVTHQKNQEVH